LLGADDFVGGFGAHDADVGDLMEAEQGAFGFADEPVSVSAVDRLLSPDAEVPGLVAEDGEIGEVALGGRFHAMV